MGIKNGKRECSSWTGLLSDRDKWETTASTLELRCKEVEEERDGWKSIARTLERRCKELSEELDEVHEGVYDTGRGKLSDRLDETKASSRGASPVYGTTAPEPLVERSQRDGLTREVGRMTDFGIECPGEGKAIAAHNQHEYLQGKRDALNGRDCKSGSDGYCAGHAEGKLILTSGKLSFVTERSLSQVKIKPLHPELGKSIPLPTRATSGAVGYDVCAAIDEPFDLLYGQSQTLIPLGFAVEIPRGYEMQIRPRSGLALEHGVTVLNAPGTIDPDYRGEVQVLLVNHNVDSAWVTIVPGDRIAQIVFAPVETPELVVTDELSETERGEGGFGSTDTDKKGA